MKKQIVFSLLLAFSVACLNGCTLVRRSSSGASEGWDGFSRAQQIVISDSAAGEVVAVLNGADEIRAFCENLDDDGSWGIADNADVPPDSERECTFAMYQTETILAGMDPDDAETIQVCTLYTYRDSTCLTMEFPFASFHFTMSDPAAAYLHSFAK